MENVVILIPCYNEQLTIGTVIDEFKESNPHIPVYVYDNLSNDGTNIVASSHGAIVKTVRPRGKGYVVNSMFSDTNAKCYVMIDGDYTYSIDNLNNMIDLILNGEADMVIGSRVFRNSRMLSRISNLILNKMFKLFFNITIEDSLSGFRAFSNEFVKSFPSTSKGFEVEIEMNLHAIINGYKVEYVPTVYVDRPNGSISKIKVLRDSFKIIFKFLKGFYKYSKLK